MGPCDSAGVQRLLLNSRGGKDSKPESVADILTILAPDAVCRDHFLWHALALYTRKLFAKAPA